MQRLTVLPVALVAAGLSAMFAATGTARAGVCLDEQELVDSVKSLEQVAKNPRATPKYEYYGICLPGVQEMYPKLLPRVLAACSTILARDAKDHLCVQLAVMAGKKEHGGVDLFAEVSTWKIDVWSWDRGDLAVILLGKLGDHRAAPRIIDAWKASIDEAARREKRKQSSSMMAWAGWRKDAAEALGAVGDAGDKPFLDDQARATKDRHVKRACLDAIAAIDKRIAAKTP